VKYEILQNEIATHPLEEDYFAAGRFVTTNRTKQISDETSPAAVGFGGAEHRKFH
jgi:hypothetical protein